MAKAGYTFSNMDAGPPGNCGNGQHLAKLDNWLILCWFMGFMDDLWGFYADLWDLWMIYGWFMGILWGFYADLWDLWMIYGWFMGILWGFYADFMLIYGDLMGI